MDLSLSVKSMCADNLYYFNPSASPFIPTIGTSRYTTTNIGNENTVCCTYTAVYAGHDIESALSGVCRVCILQRPFLGETAAGGSGSDTLPYGEAHLDNNR